jgi:hypothetical protein
MKFTIRVLIAMSAGGALALAASGTSLAVSPAQQDCEEAGGIYEFSKGTATCVIEEPFNPGNPQSPTANEPFTQEDTEGQKGQGGGGGEDTNKHHTEEEENTNPSGQAPPGQN